MRRRMMRLGCFGSFALISSTVAFVTRSTPPFVSVRQRSRPLYDIGEWRDIVFDFPGTRDDRRLGMEERGPPKEICILPFPYPEALLQGETKQLRLYEDRFITLFEDCMAHHGGVVAMGLLAESGIIQTVPLCEIEAYNRMGEGFGIFVTIRVVGRAQLIDLIQQEPYIKAVCTEMVDDIPPNLDLPNLVASNIENYMLLLSSMEHRLAQVTQNNKDQDNDKSSEDDEMQRRINVAKLEDRFYAEDDDEEEDDEDDDDEAKEFTKLDRRSRFRQAYQVAMSTDTQGYCVPTQDFLERTPQELTAISWAAFCTEVLAEDDAMYRIQALDSDNLLGRLKLASHMLQEKKTQLQTKMEKAGLKFRGDDMEDNGPSK